MNETPDGHGRTGRGDEIVLIDPDDCPGGHQFAWGQRGYAPCSEHGGHPRWTCHCGVVVYRHAGAYVTDLPCR